VAVSLSDVAAMGCRATAAFLAVALRRDHPDSFVAGLLAGARAVAAEYGVPLAGGDTTETTGPVVLCSTLLGEPPPGREPVLRSGARPGDALLVTGSLGGAGRERHLTFPPRLAQAAELVARWHPRAMIDLSDGLSTDARHLAEESGVSIRLIASAIPRSRAAGAEPEALAAALSDGEDFELLFTVPEEEAEPLARAGLAGTAVTRIGSVAAGPARVTLAGTDGTEEELLAGGYEHFR
jgi:thiamine-monophosphate kinase